VFREIKAVSSLSFSNVKNSCPALESVIKLPHTLASRGVKLGQNEYIFLLGDAPDFVQHNVSSDSAEHLILMESANFHFKTLVENSTRVIS
jgi:hypothetical protein